MQNEFDSGKSLQAIYEKYKSDNIKEKKLAYMVSSLKDNSLIQKYKTANNILIGIMVVITIITVFASYGIGLDVTPDSAIYWTIFSIIPLLFLYGFIKVNFQAYLIYIVLSFSQFSNSFKDFGADPMTDIIGLAVSLSIIAFVWFLKMKLFPYMGFLSPKKNSDKQYLVAVNS